jgi:hypothetical protein
MLAQIKRRRGLLGRGLEMPFAAADLAAGAGFAAGAVVASFAALGT